MWWICNLDGRNRAIGIAESLARAIAAIRISLQTTEISPHRPCVRCVAIRIAWLAFIRVVFVPRGTAEWPARVDRARWTLAIGDWRFCRSKICYHYVNNCCYVCVCMYVCKYIYIYTPGPQNDRNWVNFRSTFDDNSWSTSIWHCKIWVFRKYHLYSRKLGSFLFSSSEPIWGVNS